jgi:hypothetical protein
VYGEEAVTMSKSVLERYEEADAAFRRGDVESQSDEQLLAHLSGLSNQNNTNTGTQHRDVIRGLTINNILLKRHLDQLQGHMTLLNEQNSRTQRWVIALAVLAVVVGVAQIRFAYRADVKSEQAAGALVPAAVSAAPTASGGRATGGK